MMKAFFACLPVSGVFCKGLFAALLLFTAGGGQALAEFSSQYSDLDLRDCPVIDRAEEGDGEWAVMRCAGIGGLDVLVSEADLRMSLGYGPQGREQRSFNQRLSPFNTIGGKLEWRLKDGVVIATILRYVTETGSGEAGSKGQILVVSRVVPGRGEACHVAYVDALANPAANVLARYAADYVAPGFNCETDEPFRLGRVGVSPF